MKINKELSGSIYLRNKWTTSAVTFGAHLADNINSGTATGPPYMITDLLGHIWPR